MNRVSSVFSVKNSVVAALALMLMVSATAFIGGVVKANNWTGRADHHGYFDNKEGGSDSPYPDSRGPVIDNNDYATTSIPTGVADAGTQQQRKQELFDYLQNKYNNPGTYGHTNWDKTGVSFIVNTMIGNDPNAGVRNISAAMWNNLHDRLFANGVNLRTGNVSASAYGNVDTYYQYPNNDVAWYTDSSESGQAIILSVGGRDVYVLLYKCANPLGNLAGLPNPPQWTLTPSTSATKTNSTTTPPLAANEVIPGDTITWTGAIKNNGPDATDASVNASMTKSNGWTGTATSWTIGSGLAKVASNTKTFSYRAQPADLGKTLCISTTVQPKSWNDATAVTSATVCYNIVYRYELTPSITVGTPSIEAGSSTAINVRGSIYNGGPTQSKPTNWQVIECKFTSNPSATSLQYDARSGVPYYGGSSCRVYQSGNGTYGANSTQDVANFTAQSNNLPAGTRLCYGLSVNPGSATNNQWRHAALACITVLKYPKLQALGGDIRANNVQTHVSSNIGGKFYGSWGQYGIFGIGPIIGMTSAGSLANGSATDNTTADKRALTFANTPGLGTFYSAANPPALDAYYNMYYDPLHAVTNPGTYTNVLNGTRAVVSVNGDLKINQNITYSGSYASPSDIPRVIYVVNGDITVAEGVTRIDAWLIAKGTLFTCDKYLSRSHQLTTSECNKTLTFNGPVNVNDTLLGRTAGADAGNGNPNDPAEVFNLAPSAYLSTYSTGESTSNIQTVYEKELPPRW